nr:GyrI-like domain-containing protein [uncultured Roseateles sp.]
MNEFIDIPGFSVVGLPLRTSNAVAFDTIPPHWQRFGAEGVLARISGRLDDDVFGVYTDFEHAGLNNEGDYTLVIGARVAADAAVPEGLVLTHVPASRRCVFEVAGSQMQQVGATWGEVWASKDLRKTFRCDYEQYSATGGIRLMIGVE